MKKILYISIAVLLIASCKQAEKTSVSLSGAYKMDEMSYKGGTVDTVIKGAVQVIFLQHYRMIQQWDSA